MLRLHGRKRTPVPPGARLSGPVHTRLRLLRVVYALATVSVALTAAAPAVPTAQAAPGMQGVPASEAAPVRYVPPAETAFAPGVGPRLAAALDSARTLALRAMQERGFPGMAIAVTVEGRLAWSEGFGYADLEHRTPVTPVSRFRVGSISKPMTAVAVARLVASGRLDPDAPVQRYVPGFPEKRSVVTTRQLGAHLGGIRHYRGDEFLLARPFDSVAEGLEIFARDSLLHEPGSRYRYSSYGWNLISAVVEGAAGSEFLSVMDSLVFEPMGLVRTGADRNRPIVPHRVSFYDRNEAGQLVNALYVDNSYKWAGGGFLSTAEDVARFSDAAGELPETEHALLFTEQRTTQGQPVGYGFGWSIRSDGAGRRVVGHTGGSVGGTSVMMTRPDARTTLVVLVNQSSADLSFWPALLEIIAAGVGGPAGPGDGDG